MYPSLRPLSEKQKCVKWELGSFLPTAPWQNPPHQMLPLTVGAFICVFFPPPLFPFHSQTPPAAFPGDSPGDTSEVELPGRGTACWSW